MSYTALLSSISVIISDVTIVLKWKVSREGFTPEQGTGVYTTGATLHQYITGATLHQYTTGSALHTFSSTHNTTRVHKVLANKNITKVKNKQIMQT